MNNNNNKIKTLTTYLEQEISAIQQLNTLLAEEKIMLTTRQFNQLDILAEKKQDLSNQLENSASQRADLMDTQSLNEFLKKCTTTETNQINKLSINLGELLNHCRELNIINGQVISSSIHTRQEIVNLLSGSNADTANIYTSTGAIQSSAKTNHHQEA